MKVGSPEIEAVDGWVRLVIPVESNGLPPQLWFAVEREFSHLISTRCDSAALALLIPAMYRGEDLRVTSPMSPRLLQNLGGPLQNILTLVRPDLKRIKLHADRPGVVPSEATGVICGFSGGIDAFHTLKRHFLDDRVPKEMRITHLINHNGGFYTAGGESLWHGRTAKLKPVADRIGLPFIKINTNLNDFYGASLSIGDTHHFRSTAIAHFLSGGARRFLYSSNYSYRAARVAPEDWVEYSESIFMPLLASEALDVMLVGADSSRVEKTLEVAEIEDTYHMLDICWSQEAPRNCSICDKCLRTLVTLEAAGLLDRYSEVFDLAAYQKYRIGYLADLIMNIKSSPLRRELWEFLREREFRMPASAWVRAPFRRPWAAGRSAKQAIMRRLKRALGLPI